MITTAATQERGTKAARRRRGIEPYLNQIEAACAVGAPRSPRFAGADPEPPIVPLDSWAVGWIQSCTREPKGPEALPELLKECLALLVKSATDNARLRKETPHAGPGFYAAQAELMLDSALCMALLRETQTAVDELVRLGSRDDAGMLAKFRNRLQGTVRELKQSITESNRGRDDELVEEFTDAEGPRATPPSWPGPVEVTEQQPVPSRAAKETGAKRVRETARSRPRLRTEILLVLVVVALAVWLATRAVPGLTAREAKVVERDDFIASAPILEVVAPPPSAYIEVDAAGWAGNDEGRKLRVVDGMGAVLAANGYWGLMVRTPDGVVVARWIEGRGSLLLHSAPAPAQREDAPPERFDRFVPGAAPPARKPDDR